jgi:hypothetical protein
LGDTELPVTPWQFEQTCCASVVADTAGSARLRERSMFEQAARTAGAATSKTIVDIFMKFSANRQ